MKKRSTALILLCAIAMSYTVHAQEFNINFKHVKWKKALKMAKKENKLIFVDAFTTWCGPCKTLAKEVFTQEKVANYFNEHFISVKMDMEKGEGIQLKEEWDVLAYPTLLFINADGEIKHTVVGAYGADEFLSYSKMALDENRMAANLQANYDAGNRDPEFMYNYLVSLRLGYLKEKESQVANDYLKTLSNDDVLRAEQWNFIRDFANDPASEKFEHIVTNRQQLYDVVGKAAVDEKLLKTYTQQLDNWRYWYSEKPFETAKEDTIIRFLQTSDYHEAPGLLAKMLANKYKREGKNDLYLMTMDYIVSFNLEQSTGTIVSYANAVLANFESDVSLAKALQWLAIADAKEKRIEHRANILEAKSKVLAKLGDKSAAELAALAAQNADKEAEKVGKKIKTVPMMKMGGMLPAKKQ